jgi:hypothetical protein
LKNTPKKNTTKIGRRQVALHGLQVVVEPVRALDDRQPQDGDQHHHRRWRSPGADDLRLRRARVPLLVEVDGEERRAGVEHAGERAHQRRQQAGDDDAAQAGRQQVLHHQRERRLRLGRDWPAVRADDVCERRIGTALRQREADQPGDDEQVDREQLEEGGEDAAAPGLRFVRRAEARAGRCTGPCTSTTCR